jgi:hypothetical protein
MPNPIKQKTLVATDGELPSICCTILTGKRPKLLEQMLRSAAPVLAQCKQVVAYSWSNDDPTKWVLDASKEQVPSLVLESGRGEPNGPATSECAKIFLESGCDVWLHLEDDWLLDAELADANPYWLHVGSGLALNPTIGQIRLRHIDHLGGMVKVVRDGKPFFCGDGSGSSNRNWVSGKFVEWATEEGWPFMISGDSPHCSPAHVTFNPALWNREAVRQTFCMPVINELQAMERFYASRTTEGQRFIVAQLRPGVFRHNGDGHHVGQH